MLWIGLTSEYLVISLVKRGHPFMLTLKSWYLPGSVRKCSCYAYLSLIAKKRFGINCLCLPQKMGKWVYLESVFKLKSNFEHKIATKTCKICRGYEICDTNFINFYIFDIIFSLFWKSKYSTVIFRSVKISFTKIVNIIKKDPSRSNPAVVA